MIPLISPIQVVLCTRLPKPENKPSMPVLLWCLQIDYFWRFFSVGTDHSQPACSHFLFYCHRWAVVRHLFLFTAGMNLSSRLLWFEWWNFLLVILSLSSHILVFVWCLSSHIVVCLWRSLVPVKLVSIKSKKCSTIYMSQALDAEHSFGLRTFLWWLYW